MDRLREHNAQVRADGEALVELGLARAIADGKAYQWTDRAPPEVRLGFREAKRAGRRAVRAFLANLRAEAGGRA